MKLSRSDASTLLLAVTDAITHTEVTRYGNISLPQNWTKSVLETLDDSVATNFARHLDDSALAGFLRRELQVRFKEHGCPNPADDESVPLTSYESFSDPLKLARGILKRVESLPIQYRILARCSDALSDRKSEVDVDIRISDQLRIISTSNIPDNFVLRNSNAAVNRMISVYAGGEDVNLKAKESSLYFEYRCSGFVADNFDTRIVRDFSDELRSFYGLMMSYDILYDWGFGSADSRTPLVIVNELDGEGSDLVHIARMESDLVKCTQYDTSSQTDQRLKDGMKLEELLKPAIQMFQCSEAAKLTTAAIWLLRAHLGTRPMDTILDSTIAMEVLLGDRDTSDRIGLSKLMANRCAYALGRTAAERREITEFFSRFYRVRSEIVHSGRFRVTPEDRAVVKTGLELASRILRHEVRLSAEQGD